MADWWPLALLLAIIWTTWWHVTFAEDGVSALEGFLLVAVVGMIFVVGLCCELLVAEDQPRALK